MSATAPIKTDSYRRVKEIEKREKEKERKKERKKEKKKKERKRGEGGFHIQGDTFV